MSLKSEEHDDQMLKKWRSSLQQTLAAAPVPNPAFVLAPAPALQSQIAEEIEGSLGSSLAGLQSGMHTAIRLYVDAVADRTAADQQYAATVDRLGHLRDTIQRLLTLDPDAALGTLADPARAYLNSMTDRLNLPLAEEAVIKASLRVEMLRELLTLGSFGSTVGPHCTICMSGKPVTMTLTPCGHTFCEECCEKQKTACYICRNQIRDRVRIYFG